MEALELDRPQQRQSVGRSWSIVLPRPRKGERALEPATMNAAELMFFFGAPLAHVTRYEEHLRALRQQQATRRLLRANGRHDFARVLGVPVAPTAPCSVEGSARR